MDQFKPLKKVKRSLMTRYLYVLVMAIMFLCSTAGFATSYVWNNYSGGSWTTTTNWTPNGTPGATDNVTFSDGHTYTVTNVPNVSLLELQITSGTTVSLQAGTDANILKLTNSNTSLGGPNTAFYVDATSTLRLDGTANRLCIELNGKYGIGTVNGTIIFTGAQNHTLISLQQYTHTTSANNQNAIITFNNGSAFWQGLATPSNNYTGAPFGKGGTTSPVDVADSCCVVFANGSNLHYCWGPNAMQNNWPQQSAVLNYNSNFYAETVSSLSVSGKRYGNLIFNAVQSTTSAFNAINSLIVNSGGNFSMGGPGSFPITGNITVNAGGQLSLNNTGTNSSYACGITFQGAYFGETQSITNNGTLSIAQGNGTGLLSLTVKAGSTLTINSPITITGLSSTSTGGTVTNNGTLNITSPGSLSISGVLTNTGTINIGTGTTLQLNSTLTETGSGSIVGGTGSTIDFETPAAATTTLLPLGGSLTLNNLIINRTANIAIGAGGSLTISGTITQTAGTLTGTGTSNLTVNGAGNFTLPTLGSINNLTLNNTNSMILGGNITVNGTLNTNNSITPNGSYAIAYGASGALSYNGSSSIVAGVELPSTSGPKNITLNNAGGLTLSNAVTLPASGSLTITSGTIDISSFNLDLSAGNLTDASPSNSGNYIITSSTGEVIMSVPGTSTNVVFPIGTPADYNPVTLNNSGTTSKFSVNVSTNIAPYNSTDDSYLVDRLWNVVATTGSPNCIVTLQWNQSPTNDQNSNYNPSNTTLIGIWNGTSSYNTNPSTVGGSYYTTSNSGITTFAASEPFVVGNTQAFAASVGTISLSPSSLSKLWQYTTG